MLLPPPLLEAPVAKRRRPCGHRFPRNAFVWSRHPLHGCYILGIARLESVRRLSPMPPPPVIPQLEELRISPQTAVSWMDSYQLCTFCRRYKAYERHGSSMGAVGNFEAIGYDAGYRRVRNFRFEWQAIFWLHERPAFRAAVVEPLPENSSCGGNSATVDGPSTSYHCYFDGKCQAVGVGSSY